MTQCLQSQIETLQITNREEAIKVLTVRTAIVVIGVPIGYPCTGAG